LSEKYDEIFSLGKNKNKEDIIFNITYHYYDYKGKEDTFIKVLQILSKNKLSFCINFLLPDNEKLSDFLLIKDKIF
jgi:hypothetical protein